MLLKLAAVEGGFAAVFLAASNLLDGTAEKVVLYGAALTALLWIYHNIGKPFAKIIKRTAAAVDAFEDLPEWQKRTDKRIGVVEQQFTRIENGQAAIIRELGLEDQVRRTPPEAFGLGEDDLA